MAFEQGSNIGLKASPGRRTEGTMNTEHNGTLHQDEEGQGHEQVAILPTELLNHILSYTGTPAAVLAAGPAGMRTWSQGNIAEWLHQHYTDMDAEKAQTNAIKQAMKYNLVKVFNVLSADGRKLNLCMMVDVLDAATKYGFVGVVTQTLDWLSDQMPRIKASHLMAIACKYGQLEVVKALLDEAQPYACHPDDDDNICLMTAVHFGHIVVVKELLDPTRTHCAKADTQNSRALQQAALEGHVDVLLELLDNSREHHCNANDDNCRALIAAASQGHLGCLRALLDTSRAKYATADAADNMPLSMASLYGHLHIVQELLDTSRPNHTTADAHGSAALLPAAIKGDINILRELLWRQHHPADPQSEMGYKALAVAVGKGDLEFCRVLLGFPQLPPRNVDKSLLDMAASSNNPELLALLREVSTRSQSAMDQTIIKACSIVGYVFFTTAAASLVIRCMLPFLSNKRALFGWAAVASMVTGVMMRIIVWAVGSGRRKAAGLQAATLNAEYLAAWSKVKQE